MFASFLKDKVVVEPLRDVLEILSLGSSEMTLCSLRIDDCNAGTSLGFGHATFNLATYKSTEPIVTVKLFNISDVFTPGMSLLHKFLRHERPVIPKDRLMRRALANLIRFVSVPGYLGGCKYWHGRVDILVDDALPVSIAEEQNCEEDEPEDVLSVSSSIEVKASERFQINDIHQIVAETIVFSFLQQKENDKRKNLKSSLIPGIGISKKKLKILFYDSVEDVLLSTSSLDLLDVYQPQLTPIVLLWLTLNYKLFCSGITEEMKSFKADFSKRISPEMFAVYRNDVSLPYHPTKNQPDDGNWAQHNVRHVKNFKEADDTGYEPV